MSEVEEFTGEKSLQYTKITTVSADYTLLETDQILMVDTTADEVIITLPLSSWFSSGVWRNFIINHIKWDNNVKIVCSWAEIFNYGNTYFNLWTHYYSFTIWTFNNWTISTRGLVRNTTVKASAHRDANWASSNFSSTAIVPRDAEHYNNQDEILVYTSWASARYTVLTTGTYKVSYTIDIDSTGGSTWNATANVFKNWVALDNTETRTGNYGSEDQSMALPCQYISLTAWDYIDLRIDQNNLTGNMVHSMFNIEIRL